MSEVVQMNQDAENKENKCRKKIWIAGCLVAAFVMGGAGVNIYNQSYNQKMESHYSEVFFPLTTINGIVCDEQSAAFVEEQLLRTYDGYTLDVIDYKGDVITTITADDIGAYTILAEQPDVLLKSQNIENWKTQTQQSHTYEISCSFAYDKELLKNYFDSWDVVDYSKMINPTNAYIGEYDPEVKKYVIVADDPGTKLDAQKAQMIVRKALDEGAVSVDLSECYYGARIQADNEELNSKLEKLNSSIGAKVDYDWNGACVLVDSDLTHLWLVEEEDGYGFDEEKVKAFVTECSEQYDTYGKERNFTTIQGVELQLKCGAFGWQTDINKETQTLLTLLSEGTVTEKEPEYKKEGWIKGQDDIGSSYVEIDLTNQHLYVIIDGNIDFESDIVSGGVKKKCSTPAGVYGVTYKTRNATLKGPTWRSFVKYWMPFNGNIGMHDASWRKEFGGDIYINDGSHGCVNLPTASAEKIYEYVSTGFPVICYYYE